MTPKNIKLAWEHDGFRFNLTLPDFSQSEYCCQQLQGLLTVTVIFEMAGNKTEIIFRKILYFSK